MAELDARNQLGAASTTGEVAGGVSVVGAGGAESIASGIVTVLLSKSIFGSQTTGASVATGAAKVSCSGRAAMAASMSRSVYCVEDGVRSRIGHRGGTSASIDGTGPDEVRGMLT